MGTSTSRTDKKTRSTRGPVADDSAAAAGSGAKPRAAGKAPRRARTETAPDAGAAKAPRAAKSPRRAATEDGADAGKAKAPRASAKPKTSRRKTAAKTAARPRKAASNGGGGPRSLVIVESPTKSRTLNKFLGRGFMVMASNGHIMDLPKSKLGVDLDNDFEPEYVPIRGKAAALAKLQTAALEADQIYLAPDPDREGEAIAWHLAGALKESKRPLHRLTFNEITERAVKLALENPRALDMNLVNAQQARRVLDRLVGYKVSPFVWKTVRYGLSAGRVQSVALRLVCEREEEIRAFVPVEYWTLEADYETAEQQRFTARLVRVGEIELEQGQIRSGGAGVALDQPGVTARALAEELAAAEARVSSIETTPRQVHPKPPFITSTLQQTAFNRLGYVSQRTMKLAQQLYEGVALGDQGSVGLITYMRTDSPRLAGEAIAEFRDWLGSNLGSEFVPESPRQFKTKKSAQDAHEAIRPTSAAHTPEAVRPFMTEELFRLYDLIWKRALASQAASAEYLATTLSIEAGRLGLRATGRVLKFAGFQKLYGMDEEDDATESRLPELAEGTPLSISSVSLATTKAVEEDEEAGLPAGDGAEEATPIAGGAVRPLQHFTQPPPRYSEASLVKALEEENIGRPSTYATIVGTITGRDYVSREKNRLVPTDLGMAVNRLLVDSFPDIFNVSFTASMEEELDGIEEGKQEWHRVIHDFWGPFSKDLEQAEKARDLHKKKLEEPSEIACPNCGKMLVKKFGRRGPFLACPGYPECKFTRPVDDAELPVPVPGTCDLCGSPLVARNGPFGRFISCSRRPECKFTKPFTLGITCPDCGQGEIAERRTKRGKIFYGCTRYPDCTFAAWDKPRLTPCPNCKAPFLVEKVTKKGSVLRCIQCKSTFQPETIGA